MERATANSPLRGLPCIFNNLAMHARIGWPHVALLAVQCAAARAGSHDPAGV